jgi:hypothetical protein
VQEGSDIVKLKKEADVLPMRERWEIVSEQSSWGAAQRPSGSWLGTMNGTKPHGAVCDIGDHRIANGRQRSMRGGDR